MTVRDFLAPVEPLKHSLSISPDASVEEAMTRMAEANVARLSVVENGEQLGVVLRIDLQEHYLLAPIRKEREKVEAEYRFLKSLPSKAPSLLPELPP